MFPIQTVVVFSTSGDGNDLLYWFVNALVLGLGIGLNRLGSVLRERRSSKQVSPSPTHRDDRTHPAQRWPRSSRRPFAPKLPDVLGGFLRTQTIATVAKLGVADLVGDDPLPVPELAATLRRSIPRGLQPSGIWIRVFQARV